MLQQITHRARPDAGIPGLFNEGGELGLGVPSRAVNGLGYPPLAAGVGIDTPIDAELPGGLAALAHRSPSHEHQTLLRQSWASHGQLMGK